MGEPTVLFCIGATKAGTGWLWRYLRAHPDCHLRSVKELHYFDAIDRNDRAWQAAHFRRLADEAGVGPRAADYAELIGLLGRDEVDAAGYLAYLKRGGADRKLVADITPSYALLSAERLSFMARIAPDVRFIYILRDPVARLWSHIRMKAERRGDPAITTQHRANRIFWRLARGGRFKGLTARGEYREVLEKLRKAVDPGRLLVLFYEELFNNRTLARICNFLGIAEREGDFAVRVNAGPRAEMRADMAALAREWLAEQYDYVKDHFGPLPAEWEANMTRVRA